MPSPNSYENVTYPQFLRPLDRDLDEFSAFVRIGGLSGMIWAKRYPDGVWVKYPQHRRFRIK